MLTRIKEGSFSRSILKHNKGINDAKCVNVNWLTTSKPDHLQNKMDIQIHFDHTITIQFTDRPINQSHIYYETTSP